MWFKDSGVIKDPGKWDNLPGGEIFTTPEETNVEGTLALPVLDTEISADRGVDEFVWIKIKGGKITSIQGGESAKKLRKSLEAATIERHENALDSLTVWQIAEIAFGANSKARSVVADPDQPYNYPGISTIAAEKKLRTIHLAFGNSKHGEEGAEGFEDAVSHFDFVIPRNGLTVEMFTSERDFKTQKNGRKLIDNGSLRFF